MRRPTAVIVAALLVLAGATTAENWPCWRGPRLDGTSLETNLPGRWTLASNLVWKTPVPGSGHASPIVWEDRVFTVSALPETQERLLLCFDRRAGHLLWQRTVVKAPLEPKHDLNSYASSTPATDGQRVYVSFLDGKEMLAAAYDFEGRPQWLVRPGPFASPHGYCSSPVLHADKVILNGDHDGDSYLVALSRANGRVLWKTPRQNRTRSYCTPFIRELAGRAQMILSGDKSVASYDPNDGALHWIIDGPTEQFVASVVYNERAGLLFVTGGYPDHHILAVKPDGRGNITGTDKIVWRTTRGVAYVPSPLAIEDYFLVVSDAGVMHCFEAATGKVLWAERLGSHHASLVSAGGLVYSLNDAGLMSVIRPGPEFARLARNELNEPTFASPAVSQGCFFLRSRRHLFCIGPAELAQAGRAPSAGQRPGGTRSR
jgi:hypothetical protein